MAPERGRPIAKPESDSEDDNDDDDDDVRRQNAVGGGGIGNSIGDALGLASETKEERAARKKAARAARRSRDAAPANRGESEATTRECKLCGANKLLDAFPARQLRKARSACSACCSAQADADAPNVERKRKLTKREKLAEAIELRKKKKAERAVETAADVATDGDDALPGKKDDSREGFTSTNRYDPTTADDASDDDTDSSSSSEDEKEPATTTDDGLTSEERELRSKQVFVGGIPFTKTAEEIEEAFMDDMLTVDSVDCMTFPDTGRFRGIAIVTFASASIAAEALRWHDSEWDGMTLVVKPYEPKQAGATTSVKPAGDVSKVEGQHLAFVANLDYSVTDDVLRETFEDITDIRMGTDKETGDFRGYAHVEFATDEALERALAKNGEELIGGRCMKVTYATARRADKTKVPKGKEKTKRHHAATKPKKRA